MLGRKSKKIIAPYRMTSFPYLGHQGIHSVDYASLISLDLKKILLDHKNKSSWSFFLILHRITNGINMTILKTRLAIVAVSISLCTRFFLFTWSRQLPPPSYQFSYGKGKCDFWIACKILSHNVTVEGML